MFWIRGCFKYRARLLGGLCILQLLLGLVVSVERPMDSQPNESVSAVTVPSLDFSDTAVQQTSQRLIQADGQFRLFLRAAGIIGVAEPCLGTPNSLAVGISLPQNHSLYELGIALRL